MCTTTTTHPSTMTQADTGRALLQLVLDQYGPTIGWAVNGVLMTTTAADPAAAILLDAAHLLIYGQTLTTRGGRP
jgi:hypothetical protein